MRHLMAGKKIRLVWGTLATLLLLYTVAVHSPLAAQKAQVTEKDVLPILEQKCFQCHSENLKMSNLDLRTRAAMLKGGDKGPAIVPGNAEGSAIYRRIVGLETPKMPMTPMPPLSEREMVVLKTWIDQGAPWEGIAEAKAGPAPEDVQPSNTSYADYREKKITDQDRNWWAFQKPVRRALPKVDERWAKNPIDAFVKASLDAKGLTPAPQADRATLIRRAYLDLVGLLPSPTEVDEFVNDPSPRAYEDLVERLLSSHHYGERWGRFWLDVVRYADSSGFEHDRTLDSAWRYRDYVIKAFNEDKPYNQFVVEQLAGDEVDKPSYDTVTATSFYRVGPRVRFREKDNPYYRYEYLDDMIRTTFQGFMGLSVNCARCHDHKFDPITRMDYYRVMGMFYSYVNYDHPLVPKADADAYTAKTKEVGREIGKLMIEVAKIEAPYKEKQFQESVNKLPEDLQIAIRTPDEKRTPGQKLIAAQFIRGNEQDPDQIAQALFSGRPMPRMKVGDEDKEKRQVLLDQVKELQKQMPKAPPLAEGIRDGDFRLTPDGPGDEPLPGKGNRFDYGRECCFIPEPGQKEKFEVPEVHFGANGQVVEEDMKAGVVEPGYLKVLVDAKQPPISHVPNRTDYVTSGRRRALAEWIVSPENPLSSRVMVNRVWYWHFGRGIVATPGNFGKMGMAPSHPELLDWLATEFVRQGWSVKQMQRLIMNSETYKAASSFYNATNADKDPTDTYLWRFPLRRLEAEAIRDAILSASGQLNLQAGGEPFFPSIPKSVREGYRQGKWVLTKEEPSNWRRSVYSYWKRGMKYPMFEVMDQPDVNITCEKRNVSTVPTQALTMLNNEFVLIQARYLAERVTAEAGNDTAAQVKLLYRIALSRSPSEKELQGNLEFMKKQREFQVAKSAGSGSGANAEQNSDTSALIDLAHVMLNANEFVYVN